MANIVVFSLLPVSEVLLVRFDLIYPSVILSTLYLGGVTGSSGVFPGCLSVLKSIKSS